MSKPGKVIITFYSKGIPVKQGTYPATISAQTMMNITDIIKQEYDDDDVTLTFKFI